MSQDGPPLFRPIPRRPFDLHFTSPTPPDQDSRPTTPPDFVNPRFLNPTPDPISSLSRPQSFLNLTSSALYGIYSATTSGRDRGFGEPLDGDTPWGTGAQTPVKRPSVDEATFEFMKDRSHVHRRRSSFRPHDRAHLSASSPSTLFSLVPRVVLLFCLGVGYGVLVTTRFHSGQPIPQNIIRPQEYNPLYLAFWGVSGVALGALLPWFDRVWEDSFGEEEEDEVVSEQDGAHSKDSKPNTDWALVVRAIGAFVGIVFAIRKVAWASTLQVSLTLALANPLLWWLIDRSKPGLLLSAIVGLAGSAVLMGVNPDMMPAPSATPFRNATSAHRPSADGKLAFGGLARQETLETGVWILSVLFCSCVCFGNIGRRLSLGTSTAAKGRWAGSR